MPFRSLRSVNLGPRFPGAQRMNRGAYVVKDWGPKSFIPKGVATSCLMLFSCAVWKEIEKMNQKTQRSFSGFSTPQDLMQLARSHEMTDVLLPSFSAPPRVSHFYRDVKNQRPGDHRT